DEFIVVCEGVPDSEAAAAMTERLRAAVRVPVDVDGLTLLPSASLGCTLSTGDVTADQMVAEADAALYRAKAAGRGRSELFDEEMRRVSRNQTELRGQLLTALREQQLRLHYQPIVELRGNTIVGYEALLRWEHPERGLLLPAEFLAAVVDSDLDVPVTRWVLQRAATDLVELGRRSRSRPFISVNLSARQLSRPELVADVQAMTAETGLAAKRLWLEITEDNLIDHRHRPMLDRLHALGCRIALDDFGTGYSGLTYLQQMPVNVLKIDREFVARVGADRVSAGITAAVTDLADVLGITVVAEGVETAEQAELLRGMGVGMAQGYFFGRPRPLADALTEPATTAWTRAVTDPGVQPLDTVNDSMTTG
ncbi:MAG TPA: GGDEF domain-containing phosphodiesterase, partial [Mycobacteriales bacterium]|nr:GGDEF domain-containing phosphodiesterase [Mycobacteriales bacterium]